MVRLSFAQLLDFYAQAIASKPNAFNSNVRSNMFKLAFKAVGVDRTFDVNAMGLDAIA